MSAFGLHCNHSFVRSLYRIDPDRIGLDWIGLGWARRGWRRVQMHVEPVIRQVNNQGQRGSSTGGRCFLTPSKVPW